jgi:hypothetical protein
MVLYTIYEERGIIVKVMITQQVVGGTLGCGGHEA